MSDSLTTNHANPVDWAMRHRRAVLLVLVFLLIGGISAYNVIPKESEPDIAILSPVMRGHLQYF